MQTLPKHNFPLWLHRALLKIPHGWRLLQYDRRFAAANRIHMALNPDPTQTRFVKIRPSWPD